MKNGIHPEYKQITVTCSCGNTFADPFDARPGPADRGVLELPSVLHRQAEDRRHRRSRRPLPQEVRARLTVGPVSRLDTTGRLRRPVVVCDRRRARRRRPGTLSPVEGPLDLGTSRPRGTPMTIRLRTLDSCLPRLCGRRGAVIAGCAANPATGGHDVVLMSEAKEIEIGRQMHQQIMQQYGALRRRAAAGLRQRSRPAHRGQGRPPEHPVHVHGARQRGDQRVRAAGGYVYITRGIMVYLNSEAELVGGDGSRDRSHHGAAPGASADRRHRDRRRRDADRHPDRQRRPRQRRERRPAPR